MQNQSILDHGTQKKKWIIVAIAAVLLWSLTVGTLFAKYLDARNSDGLLRAEDFYFTSPLLDDQEHTLAPGSTSVTFTVGNHGDDLRYAEVDIDYTVTVTGAAGATVEDGTGTLAKDDIDDKSVTITGLQPGETYTITAVGTGGYTKTLTGTIIVPETATKLYYYLDDSTDEYKLLTVWNEGDVEGTVTIGYTGIPDNTNPNMAGWITDGSSGNVEIKAHESKVFRFFNATEIKVTGADAKDLN